MLPSTSKDTIEKEESGMDFHSASLRIDFTAMTFDFYGSSVFDGLELFPQSCRSSAHAARFFTFVYSYDQPGSSPHISRSHSASRGFVGRKSDSRRHDTASF